MDSGLASWDTNLFQESVFNIDLGEKDGICFRLEFYKNSPHIPWIHFTAESFDIRKARKVVEVIREMEIVLGEIGFGIIATHTIDMAPIARLTLKDWEEKELDGRFVFMKRLEV